VRTEGNIKRYCTFNVDERLYGVDILDVNEVNVITEFTPIFHAPATVKGYMNIRGQIYLVLDLRVLLGFEPSEKCENIVIFKSSVGEPFGVLVDRVSDVLEIKASNIENRRQKNTATIEEGDRRLEGGDFVEGVCSLEREILLILDAKKLLTPFSIIESQYEMN